MNECKFDGCQRRVEALGLCPGHYTQQRRGRELRPLAQRRAKGESAGEWLWRSVFKGPRCWTWTGATAKGYGQAWLGGKRMGVHVIAYELANGPVPEGKEIDHRCLNTLCVNPAHLRLATHPQNMQNQRLMVTNTSGYRGVSRSGNKWRARVKKDGKIYVGARTSDIEQANREAIAMRNRLFTHNTD